MSDRNLTLPGNPRYQPFALQRYFGYDNLYFGLARVEIANMQVLGEIGVIPEHEIALLTRRVQDDLIDIRTTDVDHEERTVTHHDVRAWVHLAERRLPESLRPWLHVPLTSYDVLDTGRILNYIDAYAFPVRNHILDLVKSLSNMVREHADTLQIGRTHGQHALPVTVGFWLAGILSRLLNRLEALDRAAENLVGKISGAVGASNAIVGLGFAERCGNRSYEERVLEKLGLKAAKFSTQILPPEPLADFLYSIATTSAVLGQLGRDGRHLMRTEIGELAEPFKAGQAGSSTMAHKRNPINFEGLEAQWLRSKNELGKVLDTLLSEHQRDLVGSAVMRDFPVLIVNLQTQLDTLLRRPRTGDTRPWIERVNFVQSALARNFDLSANVILAEPLYIALQMAGYQGDGHKLVSDVLTPRALVNQTSLMVELNNLAQVDDSVAKVVEQIPVTMVALLHNPSQYIGKAKEHALAVAERADEVLLAT